MLKENGDFSKKSWDIVGSILSPLLPGRQVDTTVIQSMGSGTRLPSAYRLPEVDFFFFAVFSPSHSVVISKMRLIKVAAL